MSSPKFFGLSTNRQPIIPIPGQGTEAQKRSRVRLFLTLAAAACLIIPAARADLPAFLQHVIGASSVEAALFRLMALPQLQVLYPRPPKEAAGQLSNLIAASPADPELYALRARTNEQSLDFAAAESDWKTYAAHAHDPIAGQLELAAYYQRRLQTSQEVASLLVVAQSAPIPSERFLNPTQQRSWLALERLLALDASQGLSPNATYEAFLRRYPDQPVVYTRFFRVLLDQKDFASAQTLIPRYRAAFPADAVFPITAQALLAYRRGDPAQAVAVYDRAFDPLWPAALVQNFYALLAQTHQQRTFLAAAQARLAQNPDDLNAAARIFFYFQQQGHLPAALQALDRFRLSKESRSAPWSPLELYTLASLTAQTESWPEAARYNFALAATPGALPSGEPAAQSGLAGLIHILLTASAGAEGSGQPLALGAGNLTLYRDTATLDQGPGYWNGILSLWLNGTGPASEYTQESAQAQPYFHRAKAVELLGRLDHDFPQASERASLHAELLRASAQYGDAAPIVAEGTEFLHDFPQSPDRIEIAGLMADAYARQKNTAAEFALYDSLLTELSAKTEGQPLTAAAPISNPPPSLPVPATDEETSVSPSTKTAVFDLPEPAPIRASIPQAAQYSRILDRYLSRLTATGHLPQALAVLRRELDRNPSDPLLYERLATFLQQNNLSAQEEQTYKLAISRFPDAGWEDKLARLYLRERKRQDFAALTRQVTGIFSGTELDAWFAKVQPSDRVLGPNLALQLNLYAQKRFPHDLVFTRNLLAAYTAKETANPAAFEALLRASWWQAPDLRDRFFEFLSRTGKLDAELAQLNSEPQAPGAPSIAASPQPVGSPTSNPAAVRELAEADLWTSHFEQSAPLMGALADLYPADPDLGDRAVSLFRSLAYLDPTSASTQRAVAVETNLLTAAPDSPNRLATLGDLYAEATSTGGEDLARAAPYWRRIPSLHPGSPAGSLTAATIFWDYFQFDSALAELNQARARFHAPTLYGFEAGAIQENRHDLPAAIAEYTAVVTMPPAEPLFVDSVHAAVGALLQPPSDAADSNLQSTAQSIFNSAEARVRLLRLATRPASASLVDRATAQAAAKSPTPVALTLRADVLFAQHRASELAPLLEQALTRAQTPEQAAAIGDLARAHSQDQTADASRLQQVTVRISPTGETIRNGYTAAGSYGLTSVYEHALLRQIALTTDPIEKIELQFTLARAYEDRKDLPAANQVIAAVYQANPRILGVVRTSVDFYARTQQPTRAIATLLEAAKAATPDLCDAFTLEAAQKANDAGDTAQARALALALLQKSPYDARFLAAAAQSYARANDNAGLKQFYLARLELVQAQLRAATLSREQAKQDTALLRRGLIPALTRLQDFPGALDQYIALISAYPEDAATAQEAALYALQHHAEPQLLAFLRTTVHDSPRDARFAILLAQTESTFGDLPAALAAYSQAIAIRKDRVDLYTARADLELRLDQPDAAAADFDRLFGLTYHDPAWMLRLAELRARQQRPADTVKALETAFITGRTPDPHNQFAVARYLDQWNLLPQARAFAEQGIALAGNNLLVLSAPPDASAPAASSDEADETPDNTAIAGSSPHASGAALYARILTRLNQPDRALATLAAARTSAESATPSVLDRLTSGFKPQDAPAARTNFADQRRQAIARSYTQALTALGAAVQTFATPEQKLHFAQLLDQQRQADRAAEPQLWIAVAHAAGLADREADWRAQALLAPGNTGENLAPYIALQQSRLQFTALGQTLESYARKLKPGEQSGMLQQAAQAFRSAGDETGELRLVRELTANAASALVNDRFFDLLLRHDPAALDALASSANATLADAAVNFTLAHGTPNQAFAAVHARSTAPDLAKSAVWQPATTALTGLYFASAPEPAQVALTDTSFRQILAPDASIADRLAHPADPARQLTGSLWFAYGASYGIFRFASPSSADSEDLLASELEDSPGTPTPYVHLARTYDEANHPDAALAEYTHALELLPGDPAILDEQAVLLLRLGRKDAALSAWRAALATLQHNAEKNAYPESFWSSYASILKHLGEHALTATLRPAIEQVLRPYFEHNGNYRSNQLLQQAFAACATPEEGTALILAATSALPQEDEILADLRSTPLQALAASSKSAPPFVSPTGDVVDSTHEALLLRRIQIARTRPADTPAQPGVDTYAEDLIRLQIELLDLYLQGSQLTEAQALLDSMPDQKANAGPETDRIELAVRTGHLSALLASWTAQPERMPEQSQIDSALFYLQRPTPAYHPDPAQIRPLLEFDFNRKRLAASLRATDFLALAQSRLDTGDLPGALDLLRQLALQPVTTPALYVSATADITADDLPSTQASDRYANVDSAARLLETTHHPAEAIPFLSTLTRNVPWNSSFRLRLAEAQAAVPAEKGSALENLTAVASDPLAPYPLRIEAAQRLGQTYSQPHTPAAVLGSAELDLLASANRSPQAARQPYFTAARTAAATPRNPASAALLQEALAFDPTGTEADRARFQLLTLTLDTAPTSADPAPVLALFDTLSRQPTPSFSVASEAPDGSLPDQNNTQLPDAASSLDPLLRARLAAQLADAFERNAENSAAVAYLELAARLDPANSALTQHLAHLRLAIALAAANASRRPVIHHALEQAPQQTPPEPDASGSRQVRPRLIAALPARLSPPQEAP